MEFAGLAQDFVEATSLLVGGRTINIMDRQGIIIASTETERVSTYHQGAAEVIATGKAVLIHRDDLNQYPGAKEGYNMPIFLEGDLIGVVGIFGEEDEVRDIANLLKVYVTQFFRQQEWMQKEKLEAELRTRILKLLLYGDDGQADMIMELCHVLSVQIVFPLKVFLFTALKEEKPVENLNHYSQLEQMLSWQGILDKKKDIYGIHENRFIILHGCCHKEGKGSYAERISRFTKEYSGYRLSVSGSCKMLRDIPRGMKEVNALGLIMKETVSDMEIPVCQMRYLTYNMLKHGGSCYVAQMYERLQTSQDENHIELLLVTAGVYYEEGGSVTKAAERLHLHKNTLLYRMSRIWGLLGILEEQAYVKEFYIRLLLEYHPFVLPGAAEHGV